MGAKADSRKAARNVRKAFMAEIHSRQPGFRTAVVADLAANMRFRGQGRPLTGRFDTVVEAIKMMWTSDAYFAQVLYRARTAMARRGVPFLPRLFHHWAISNAQVCIGDPVVIGPGLYLAHGQVVIDGITTVGSDAVFFPWVTVGLKAGVVEGPVIGDGARVGTGAKVIGPVKIGDHVSIGANSVVLDDVASHSTVIGAPARPLSR